MAQVRKLNKELYSNQVAFVARALQKEAPAIRDTGAVDRLSTPKTARDVGGPHPHDARSGERSNDWLGQEQRERHLRGHLL